MTGTIAPDGNHMSGTFNDSAGHNGFTWSATRVSGPPVVKPVLGRAVTVGAVGGQVLVKLPGQGFAPLSAAEQVPVGSLLDTSSRHRAALERGEHARGGPDGRLQPAGCSRSRSRRTGAG